MQNKNKKYKQHQLLLENQESEGCSGAAVIETDTSDERQLLQQQQQQQQLQDQRK